MFYSTDHMQSTGLLCGKVAYESFSSGSGLLLPSGLLSKVRGLVISKTSGNAGTRGKESALQRFWCCKHSYACA